MFSSRDYHNNTIGSKDHLLRNAIVGNAVILDKETFEVNSNILKDFISKPWRVILIQYRDATAGV